jgi:hypothetical protein
MKCKVAVPWVDDRFIPVFQTLEESVNGFSRISIDNKLLKNDIWLVLRQSATMNH